jgi:hypothetical protein
MIDKSAPRRRLPLKKRLLFGVIAIFLVLPLVETISWLAISMLRADGMYVVHLLQDHLAISGVPSDSGGESIHPYLGWVMNPQVNHGSDLGDRHISVNGFGFNDEELSIPKRRADRLVVGVLGGSVAWQMTVLGESAFRDALRQNIAWRDKDIRIVRLAMSGYKQPQQLMALNFLLTLGAEFDVIVNIDGYNEIALPVCENNGTVFAAYPRMWDARTLELVDPRVNAASFHLLQARGTRQELAQNICRSWFRWSPTFNLVWMLRDMYWQNELVELETVIRQHKFGPNPRFSGSGPRQLYANEAEMYDHVCDIWKQASLQLNHLCRGNGTLYVHFLQPNQYLPGSKPMGAKEREERVVESQQYGKSIARGYPLLMRAGQQLREQGIRFWDLTMLFANVDDPIYVDEFCHYNAQGNEMLARAIAARMIEASTASE